MVMLVTADCDNDNNDNDNDNGNDDCDNDLPIVLTQTIKSTYDYFRIFLFDKGYMYC